jgi:hypothetical protein
MSEPDQFTPVQPAHGVGRAVWLRLVGALLALAAGAASLVVAIDLIRTTLS